MPARPAVDPEVATLTGVAHRFALSLAVLVTDQALTSESDRPFEPFTAALPVGQRLNATAFRDALGFEPSRRVDIESARRFFDNAATATEEAEDARAGQVFALLETVMQRTLGRLSVVFVRGDGVVEVPFFLFGRLAGGPLVGLRSIAIET